MLIIKSLGLHPVSKTKENEYEKNDIKTEGAIRKEAASDP